MAEEINLQLLAEQLRCPSGDQGLEIAQMMDESNITMTQHAIDQLPTTDSPHLLEVGHGGSNHLSKVLNKWPNAHYTGLDIAPLMHERALGLHSELIRAQKASFYLYDGLHMPFESETFDLAFTVNTLYFWDEPEQFLNEMYRVMTAGGSFVVTFGFKSYMKMLPFTSYGFTLYDMPDFEKMVARTPFQITSVVNASDYVRSKAGTMVHRDFASVVLER